MKEVFIDWMANVAINCIVYFPGWTDVRTTIGKKKLNHLDPSEWRISDERWMPLSSHRTDMGIEVKSGHC